MYKHFIGVKNKEELKAKYRELAKKHHPDRGGNEAIFKELVNEYNGIDPSYASFPISNPVINVFENGAEIFADAMRGYGFRQRPQAEQPKRTPEEQMWYIRKQADENYDVLDDLVGIFIDERKTTGWLLSELVKMDDLNLDHFKYVVYLVHKHPLADKMKLVNYWASISYRNYLATKTIKWA